MRVLLLAVFLGCSLLPAQDTSILATARKTDWTLAGAGTIPTRTTSCSNLTSSATAANINSAISGCSTNGVVNLAAGTYTINAGLIFDGKSNVTLRGAGADQTFLNFTGSNGCGGKQALICIRSSNTLDTDSPPNTATWSAGYTHNTTTITVSSTTNLSVGSIIVLEQTGDNGDTDAGNDVYDCNLTPTCTQNGNGSNGDRISAETHKVTAIAGSNVTITPPLLMPHWRSGKSPRAYWASGLPVTGVGVENLSISPTSSGAQSPFGISFFTATHSWVRGVRTVNNSASSIGYNKHILMFTSALNTVRDSYFFNCTGNPTGSCANDNYGIDMNWAGANLIENNIFQRMEVPLMNENKSVGNVWGYNFTINNRFQGDASAPTEWLQQSGHDHGTGNSFNLYESNDGNGTIRESYFGLAFFFTEFRNRWSGWEPANLMNQSVPVLNNARSRFHNYIGNVLGTNGYHTKYQVVPGDSSSCIFSIFAIGLGGNCEDGSTGFPNNDTNTLPSIMRWGNYDLVNDASRFVSGEVPSGIANYSNSVPGDNNLPASFYLPARPPWYKVNGVTAGWPAIGPDITNGDVTGSGTSVNAGLASHVWKIPARRCFEDVMGGTFSDTTAKTFNPDSCYSDPGAATSPTSLLRGVGRTFGVGGLR